MSSLEILKGPREFLANFQQLIFPFFSVFQQNLILSYRVCKVSTKRGNVGFSFSNQLIFKKQSLLQFLILSLQFVDGILQGFYFSMEVILLLDKPVDLCCLSLNFLLKLSSINDQQILDFAVLFYPPAVIVLKFPILDNNGLLVMGFQLFNIGLELSLCLISDYLCAMQLLVDITLQLLYLFFMPTQLSLFFRLKGLQLFAELLLIYLLQFGYLSCMLVAASNHFQFQSFDFIFQISFSSNMLGSFLRMHNLNRPNLFAKHQAVLHTSLSKIINLVSYLIDLIDQNLFHLLILIEPAFQLLIPLQIKGLFLLYLPQLILNSEQYKLALLFQLCDLEAVSLLQFDLDLLVLAIPLLVIVFFQCFFIPF